MHASRGSPSISVNTSPRLTPGDYTVRVAFTGFSNFEATVTIQASDGLAADERERPAGEKLAIRLQCEAVDSAIHTDEDISIDNAIGLQQGEIRQYRRLGERKRTSGPKPPIRPKRKPIYRPGKLVGKTPIYRAILVQSPKVRRLLSAKA